jgi:hypothetical protein
MPGPPCTSTCAGRHASDGTAAAGDALAGQAAIIERMAPYRYADASYRLSNEYCCLSAYA